MAQAYFIISLKLINGVGGIRKTSGGRLKKLRAGVGRNIFQRRIQNPDKHLR